MVVGSFPSLMATLIASTFSDTTTVGLGAVIGSMLFNQLVVVGLSVIVGRRHSKDPLTLAPSPTLRDMACCVLALVIFRWAIQDGGVRLHEALILSLLFCGTVFASPSNSFSTLTGTFFPCHHTCIALPRIHCYRPQLE